MAGFFITFEGIEGSGKSTQIKLLTDKLKELDYKVVFTKEPGGTEIGEKIRNILLDPIHHRMDDRAEILLYAADRAQHVVETIIPAVEEDKIVISDRYIDSNIAYQGHGRELDMEMVRKINEWVIRNYWPDLTILLDLDVKKGLRRARDLTPDKTGDRLEREVIDFHENVRKGYLKMAEKYDRFKVIDASRDSEIVHQDILRVIKEELL
ncbi:MAG: dTMP kinase [Halanaerobiales bacterium]